MLSDLSKQSLANGHDRFEDMTDIRVLSIETFIFCYTYPGNAHCANIPAIC